MHRAAPFSWFLAATAQEREGRYREAISGFQAILESEPDHQGALMKLRSMGAMLVELGYEHSRRNDLKAAVEALELAFEADSHHRNEFHVAFNLATFLIGLGQFDRAIVILEHCVTLDPTVLYSYVQLSYAYVKLGMTDKANAVVRRGFDVRAGGVSGSPAGTPLKTLCGMSRDFTSDEPNVYVAIAEECIERFDHPELWISSSDGEIARGKIEPKSRCEAFVARLENVELVGPELVLSRNITERLCGSNPYDGVSELRHLVWLSSALEQSSGSITEFDAPQGAIAIASDVSSNYYHWLFDNFARLSFVEAFPELHSVPILLPMHAVPFVREQLQQLEWPGGYLPMWPGINRFRRLYVPSRFWHGAQQASSADATRWLRDRARRWGITAQAGGKKRLFLTRKAATGRRILDEEALQRRLTDYGFETIDPGAMGVREQMTCFAGADVIVSPHGAGLANLPYMPEGGVVVELSSDQVGFNPVYAQITATTSCRHAVVNCRSVDSIGGVPSANVVLAQEQPGWADNNKDIIVDSEIIFGILEKFGVRV